MLTSTRPGVRATPTRRIPWTALAEERDVADQLWSALPAADPVSKSAVLAFLRVEGLESVQPHKGLIYAYADGPQETGSPVETEWRLQFHFAADQLTELTVEKHLVGP
jgi:hypothetical protein